MSLLTILKFPDPRLKKTAVRIETIDEQIHQLAKDMAETMYAAPGVGLAATQVDVQQRLIVIDVSEARDELLVLVNPELVETEGKKLVEEGCLSVPGVYEKVERAERVVVRYLDLAGKEQHISGEGMLAVCLQHEIEHLDGHIFVEHLSQLKQSRIKTKMLKQAKEPS